MKFDENISSLKNGFLIPLSLLLFSFILRVTLISKGPYHVDCLNLALNAEELIKTHQLTYQTGFGYPLVVILAAFFTALSKLYSIYDSVFAVNFMSVVFSSASVVILYFFVKSQLEVSTAFFSGILFSMCPLFLGVSVYGTSHTPCIFFLLGGLYFLVNYLKKKQRCSLLLGGVSIGLMAACRLQDMILMTVPILYFLMSDNKRIEGNEAQGSLFRSFGDCLLFLSVVALVAVAFHFPYLIGESKDIYRSQLSDFILHGAVQNFRGLFSDSMKYAFTKLVYNFTYLGLLLAILGAWILSVNQVKFMRFLVVWFLIPLIFYGNLYSSVSRFFIISCIPLYVFIGVAISHLYRKSKVIKIVSIFCFLFIMYKPFFSIYPILKLRHEQAFIPEYVRWVKDNTEDNAVLITIDFNLFYSYYGPMELMGRPIEVPLMHITIENLDNFRNSLDAKFHEGIPVYITDYGLHIYDYLNEFSRYMENNYDLIEIGSKLNESWYRGEDTMNLSKIRLYRILPKIR